MEYNTLVVGMGQIGTAMYEVLSPVLCQDGQRCLETFDIADEARSSIVFANAETIHICIPYSERFIGDVKSMVKKVAEYITPDIYIHSTVPPGTCRALKKELLDNKIYGNVFHAPIRGVHPNLAEGIKKFPMYVSGESKLEAIKATLPLTRAGIECKPVEGWETTELAKLLDTTYYGVCIAFHDYAYKLCQEFDVDFDTVMTEYNKSYNEVYPKLGKPNVVRPVLTPPKGKIGGHCVVPNAELLNEIMEHALLKSIIDLK